MATGIATPDADAVRSGHNRPDQQLVAPGRSSRKRRHSAKCEAEDIANGRRKSRRILESTNQRPPHASTEHTKSARQNPRLQGTQSTKLQQTAKGGQTRASNPRREGVKQYPEEQEIQFEASPRLRKSPEKRCYENNGDDPNHQAKRPRRGPTQYTESRNISPEKEDSIQRWLEDSSWSRRVSTEHRPRLSEPVIKMACKAAPVLPFSVNSIETTTSTSRKSDKPTANVHGMDYRDFLGYRNIYIESQSPPIELMLRANRIISRQRLSPEMDDAIVQKVKENARKLQNEAEDKIIKQLAPHIIPAMTEIPDQRLEMNTDQRWFNPVPIPLDASILTDPLPLPKPKPNLVFGYSKTAFTRNQLGTIDLLLDDHFGRSYALPDQKIRFPFLQVEFKSQAKNGTHYIAANQAAGAGAIALNGNMDLIRRSFGIDKFDYEEPQYFSISMDHELARINVHWLGAPNDGGQHSFHVEGLSKHLLDDEKGIRALSRAIKNILDNGADKQLRTLSDALDEYRDTVVRNRTTVNPRRERNISSYTNH
ncbi:hypothetical protein AYL99_08492 [Fonsecaea erecta]|uniref:DUF7924 domain-containing protein n=1 Tax=Fonsecaea erecta TaxID=1367422 RepID=A0A178ZD75_9EURO|nr:hypothetical protein AYL99_08492 [Fonsecaea erecta]OAP57754.1 hypothetical protein AYL99_08492 [Fonsecaea erecta]